MTSSSGYAALDERVIQLVNTLPGNWEPATNAAGEKVEQEFVFSFGTVGCLAGWVDHLAVEPKTSDLPLHLSLNDVADIMAWVEFYGRRAHLLILRTGGDRSLRRRIAYCRHGMGLLLGFRCAPCGGLKEAIRIDHGSVTFIILNSSLLLSKNTASAASQ